MALKTEKQIIEEFNELKFQDYSRKGQDYEFIETDMQLNKVGEILDGVKDYTPQRLRGRVNLHSNVTKAIKEFVDICKSIRDFDATARDPNQTANQIKQNARKLYDQFLVPDSSSNYSTFPALAIDNKLKTTNLNEINDLVDQITNQRDKAAELTKQIEDSSRSKFAQDYSEIFHHEAKTHSRISFKKGKDISNKEKNTRLGLGFAEVYFLFGVAFTGLLIWLILTDYFMPDPNLLKSDLQTIQEIGISSVSYSQVLIPFYLKKVVILAIIFFGIRFSFKQFAIHKHLHTVNQHRANTLDSFDFFHKNLKDSDADSRDQYLIEVAKSIFNMSDTGFIKNESKESISVIDNFKFFKDQS